MAKLIYFTPASLDGFIADETVDLDWSTPDEQVMAFINELMRPIGTYLYGRKTYEMMVVWQTPEVIPNLTAHMRELAPIWSAAGEVVYSRSMHAVPTPNTRLEHQFDSQAVHDLKARSAHDVTVGGPVLAAQAIRAGLVDEYHLLVIPAMLGRGRRVLPDNARIELKLLDERRVGNGWIYLRYRNL